MSENNSTQQKQLRFDRDIMFSNHKNQYKQGIEKRQQKFLQQNEYIKSFLSEDETINLITFGCSPMTVLEQLLMGWMVFYVKRSIFIFTNKRLFIIPVGIAGKYRNSIGYILYSDCKNIGLKMGTLKVEYADGKKEKYYYIQGKERKKVKSIVSNIKFGEYVNQAKRRTSICPRCKADLIQGKYSCPNCNLEFKSKSEALKYSIIYPGGGYFYTRHTFLGLGDALTESVLIILFIAGLIANKTREEMFSILFIGVILVIEKLVTIYDSNKFVDEFITKTKEIIH